MEKHVPFWSKRLRQERERRGWSQSHVAEKIGVDTKTVGRWEKGMAEQSRSGTYRQVLASKR